MDSQPPVPYSIPPASTGTFTIVPGNSSGQLPPHAATAGFNVTDVFCHNVTGGSRGRFTMFRAESMQTICIQPSRCFVTGQSYTGSCA